MSESNVMMSLGEREAAVIASETLSNQRERAAAQREHDATLREHALHEQDDLLQVRATRDAHTKALLRDANERLVLAAVNAQTMAEAAETAAAQMSHMAQHDFLTGLPNRALLTDRLAQSIALAKRHGKRVALMYLDLDHFKHINDSLGHAVGDQLLQSVAKRLRDCIRVSDTVCRQGGDEFVVLLAEVDAVQDAALTAEKLIDAMSEPHCVGGHPLHVSVSIGVSIYPEDGKQVETLLRHADTAMYHAKKYGRNNYQFFVPEMNVLAVARQSVEAALRQALGRQGFVLHFQPKLNLVTRALTGVEALVRLRRPDNSLLYPTQFVSVAEDTGLILQIGKWVLSEACRQTVLWQRAGLDIGQIAVNVSAVELQGKNFVGDLRAILEESGLDPQHLEVELTESGLMQDTQRTGSVLRSLRDLGVQIAIDDFGTGYSSLSYLRRFPINTLKIDQSFIHDIHGDEDEAVLVSAIIAMGNSLKLRVVAEGIETAHQSAYLQAQGCMEGQGHYFSHAVDAQAFQSSINGRLTQ